MKFNHKKLITAIAAMLLLCSVLLTAASCAIEANAKDLMKGIDARDINGKQADDIFVKSAADFSLELFKKSMYDDKNSLISPLSVFLALSMTANGANGETLSEMEATLGRGISLDDLNEYLHGYTKSLESKEKPKLEIANSIWIRESIAESVIPAFLQKNADYYGAAAYRADFDSQTVKDINSWVKANTDGMIDKVIDEISADTIMYLINTIVFDAEWKEKYDKNDISDKMFTNFDESKSTASMMYSEESLFVGDDSAKGFIKPYANGKYSFVALLPNEGISVTDYVSSLDGDSFVAMIKGAEEKSIYAGLPKFTSTYEKTMNDLLKEMGIKKAFNTDNDSDLSKMIDGVSPGEAFISMVLHKTFISVDEIGTKAGAVTVVQVDLESAPMYDETIILDRPFAYAIIDNATGLPIFIGTTLSITE